MSSNTKELRKAATAVFISCEEPVAKDLSEKLKWAADEIDRLKADKPEPITGEWFETWFNAHSNYHWYQTNWQELADKINAHFLGAK